MCCLVLTESNFVCGGRSEEPWGKGLGVVLEGSETAVQPF